MPFTATEFWAASKALELHRDWLTRTLAAIANGEPVPPHDYSFTIPPDFPEASHAAVADLVRDYIVAIHNLPAPTFQPAVLNTGPVDASVQSIVALDQV